MDKKVHDRAMHKNSGAVSVPARQTSMCSLIIWNISKALEKKPSLDLREAIRSAYKRVESEPNGSYMETQPPEYRHLMCAMLAWQQLGHKDVDDLYQFIIDNQNKPTVTENSSDEKSANRINKAGASVRFKSPVDSRHSHYSKNFDTKFDTYSLMGPVVKLPVESKIIMRVENTRSRPPKPNKPPPPPKKLPRENSEIMKKIDAACCQETACVKRLKDLENAVNELRTRAVKLAWREAERAELLERAEAAWKNLEQGYQRRLSLAEENEHDIIKQIQKLVEERNDYKKACMTMAETLKERGDNAENDRYHLSQIEKNMCDRACVRLQLSEESARGDSALAEQLCRITQLDRDLQCKEDQARRKVLSLESEIDSERGLTYEAERAMRAELEAIKKQVSEVSKQLLEEESENSTIKAELESLRKEKFEMIEDLDGCKIMCDGRMQSKVEELKQKRDQLNELKEKVLECQCKLPQDATVGVKRTPSLAALCYCAPEDKFLESCSCTSLRSQLLSNLLADLFGGLQSELGGSGSLMPCQLLKCLEDRHNWDRTSIVKTNLLKFFGELLIGELDIAIATSIEKYHAKWVGACCADQARVIPEPGDKTQIEGWQDRAIERRAQKLASQLAEQLFKDRADELTKRAKELISGGPPPCECKPPSPAVFPCFVKQPTIGNIRKTNDTAPSYLKRTMQDVTNLRTQIEDLKKESIKKGDLRKMEEKFTKIVARFTKPDNSFQTSKNNKMVKEIPDEDNEKIKILGDTLINLDSNNTKKRVSDSNRLKKNIKNSLGNQKGRIEKHSSKLFKKMEQSFAVNLCLCGDQNKVKKQEIRPLNETASKIKKEKEIVLKTSSIKQSKPIALPSKDRQSSQESKVLDHPICPSSCVCFHKIPSNTSIDKLLETLNKWRGDLGNISSDKNENVANFTNTQLLNSGTIEDQNDLALKMVNKSIENNQNIYNSSNLIEKISTEDDVFCNKGTSCDTALPPATESEYIGAVNLDKSNENYSKFNINAETKQVDGIVSAAPIRYQCLNSDSCKCKKSDSINQNKKESNKINTSFHTKGDSLIYSVEQETRFLTTDDNKLLTSPTSKKAIAVGDSFIKDVVKKSDLFPCSCDYRIKFLGVTLGNSKNDKNSIEKQSSDKSPSNHKDKRMFDDLNKKNTSPTSFNKDVNNNLRCGLNSCEYGKQLLDSINDSRGHSSVSPDITEKTEECICCSNMDRNDLEVNVFNLLEEHLKGKFNEFQRSLSNSVSLQPEEEKLLFSTIVNKVKKVISESTGNLSCKCIQEKKSEGSWSRVYGLLQEYLKIKLKRVQCSCTSRDKSAESFLPGILEKVNNLIEEDFQRLRDKCGRENKINNSSFQIKSKQETKSIQECQDHNETYVQFDARDIDYLKDNSLQASNINISNKSCETMDNKLFKANTSEKQNSCELNRVYGTLCDCNRRLPEYSPLHKNAIVHQCTKIIPMQEKEVSDAMNLVAKISVSSLESTTPSDKKEPYEEPSNLDHPYIGYTISCSCDRTLGLCRCSKSTVETNSNQIDFIWKTLTNELYPKKMSYIMPKIVANVRSEHIVANKSNYHYSSENNIKNKSDKLRCDTEICTSYNEDITLKDSKDKYTGVKREAFTTNNIPDLNQESISNACEPQSVNIYNHSNESNYEKKKLYDSLYLPTERYLKKKIDSQIDTNLDWESEMCGCKMVPICHVKMLVDNIEKKLMNSKCTCDALHPKACPVHNAQEYY